MKFDQVFNDWWYMQCTCTGAERLCGDVTASRCLSVVWVSYFSLVIWCYMLFVFCFPPLMSTLCHGHCSTVCSKLVMKQVVPSADFGWCYARVILMCELTAWLSIWIILVTFVVTHTSKLSEDSVTVLVESGCICTKKRDWRFKLTLKFWLPFWR